jgi:hypothetical protein
MTAIQTTNVLAGTLVGTLWDGAPSSTSFFYRTEKRPANMRALVAAIVDREGGNFRDRPRFSPLSVLTILRWGTGSGHRGRSWPLTSLPSLARDITIYSWEPDFRGLSDDDL